MKTNIINNANCAVFSARLVCNQGAMKKFMNSKADTESKTIVVKIAEALQKHPSDCVIKLDVVSKIGMYGTRGVISSRLTTYKDVEPTENNGRVPIKNILRRILDPENKECFNKLVGESHSNIYNNWWNENIAPIWSEINKTFRTNLFFAGNHDKDFNQDFRNRKERTWYNLLNK